MFARDSVWQFSKDSLNTRSLWDGLEGTREAPGNWGDGLEGTAGSASWKSWISLDRKCSLEIAMDRSRLGVSGKAALRGGSTGVCLGSDGATGYRAGAAASALDGSGPIAFRA